MADVRERTAELIEEHPDVRSELEELAELDEAGRWAFDDASIGSGRFGEVVARGIAEKRDGGYRLADRAAVRAALAGENESTGTDARSLDLAARSASLARLAPAVSAPELAVLGVAVATTVLVRTVFAYSSVYRDGTVVLAGNDPYRYRYWTEFLLSSDLPAFAASGLANLPGYVQTHDTLTIVLAWWTAALLGGDAGAAGHVLAWYPVVAAAAIAVCVYGIARQCCDDVRVHLAAPFLFAVIPVVASRTMLGFGDHHALTYAWLAVTLLGLALAASARDAGDRVADDPGADERSGGGRDGAYLASVALVGVGAAGQVLSWRGGPILLVPLGVYGVGHVLADVDRGRSPTRTGEPLVVALALAAVATLAAHLAFGWLQPYRALAPGLVLAGLAATVAVGEWTVRRDRGVRTAFGTLAGVGVGGGLALWLFVPAFSAGLTGFLSYMAIYTGGSIAETQSLLTARSGIFVTPLLFFGFLFYLAVPYVAWATLRLRESFAPVWLLLTVYAWYFLAFSLLQVRFAAQLAIVLSVFAAWGLIDLAARLDILRPPAVFEDGDGDPRALARDGHRDRGGGERSRGDGGRARDGPAIGLPDRRTATSFAALVLFVVGFALVQAPIEQGQIAVDDTDYETAAWMADDAEELGLAYPASYVFSPWDVNMMFNYYVSGHSRSYGYAREHYDRFARSDAPGEWYRTLEGRAGYVVVEPGRSDFEPGTVGNQLSTSFGSRTGELPAVSHYRAVYRTPDERYTVYRLVPGATVTGTAEPNATVTATVEVSIGGAAFTYEQRVRTDAEGAYSFTTPYPGEYTVGGRTVDVPERAVREGRVVNATAA